MSLIPTRASRLLNVDSSHVDVVKFERYKPKQKTVQNSKEKIAESATLNKNQKQKEIDLKKIRHEIFKFGMSGFSAPKREEARIALAISLGAKPPKKEYKNYKQLMEEKKLEKQKDEEERRLQLLGKEAAAKAMKQGNKKKKESDVGKLLNIYGKVDKKEIEKSTAKPQKTKKKHNQKFKV